MHVLSSSERGSFLCSIRMTSPSAGDTAIPYTYGKDNGVDPEQYANTKLYVSWGVNECATNVHALVI